MYKIDNSIPPPTARGPGRPAVYPFMEMAVGDSFVVPEVFSLKARLSASQWKRRVRGFNYTSRKEGDFVRIWRTA